ncbi:MAG: inosine/guanosine kinase [Deltaproteobacteria bacterium]|nr:inosine/guanosine kinase [Deltaproteobacteria bacterium]
MRFPGKRKTKHYFPVSDRGPESLHEEREEAHLYIVGIDQLLVDIEAEIDDGELAALGIPQGGSQVLDTELVDRLYADLKVRGRIVGEYAGGSVGNTLHNYSVLADDLSYLIGSINRTIAVGDYAFHYIRNTSSRVNLAHLQPVDGPMGRAFCFVTPDRERSFGISRGIMDELHPDAIPSEVIAGASALVLTAYLLRDPQAPIHAATRRAIDIANQHRVPVVLSLGTEWLVREQRAALVELLQGIEIGVLAGNYGELCALTGQDDALLASRAALDWADLVLLTRDKHGLYLSGWTDPPYLRETRDPILSKSIAEYNRYEYSRAMPRKACVDPQPVFSHINPYHGGPSRIHNTNGAGDAALGALLHDLVANAHHRRVAPNSPKHVAEFLTYSSIHQVCKYANRVSYEVLRNHCPRLLHGLPEREDSLEEAYWVQ